MLYPEKLSLKIDIEKKPNYFNTNTTLRLLLVMQASTSENTPTEDEESISPVRTQE